MELISQSGAVDGLPVAFLNLLAMFDVVVELLLLLLLLLLLCGLDVTVLNVVRFTAGV